MIRCFQILSPDGDKEEPDEDFKVDEFIILLFEDGPYPDQKICWRNWQHFVLVIPWLFCIHNIVVPSPFPFEVKRPENYLLL